MPTASELWPPACASVTDRCHLPQPQRIPCTPWILPFATLEPISPHRVLTLPWSAGVEGQERAQDKRTSHCQKLGCPGLALSPGALGSWISIGLYTWSQGDSPTPTQQAPSHRS